MDIHFFPDHLSNGVTVRTVVHTISERSKMSNGPRGGWMERTQG